MNNTLSPLIRSAAFLLLSVVMFGCASAPAESSRRVQEEPRGRTSVSIVGNQFFINGQPTYKGREWKGHKIEGLLMNSRNVQGIFDDRNPATVGRWAYPDTGRWDPKRNTREFIAAMPEWRRHGLLAFTINLQGGSPQGYSQGQPWHNSAIEADGSLRADYMQRLEQIITRADQLGMVVILGYFYFGQDERLTDEAAVVRAVDAATDWVLARGYRNVVVEINNECNVRYDHEILRPDRVHELIERVQARSRSGRRLLVSTSYGGGTIPKPNVARTADFILIHGNGVSDPKRISEMVRQTRAVSGYRNQPIVFNEDDHFDFDKPMNNFVAAVSEYASWGYFDPGASNYQDGYQCPPVFWGLNTPRKRDFFNLVAEMTGAPQTPSFTPMAGPVLKRPAQPKRSGIYISRVTHRGWTNAISMSNGASEVVIVPQIGRIMQFRLAGDKDGPFWENTVQAGAEPDPKSTDWINFGGDKTWPAPQGDWPKVAKRGWPPPATFDAAPVEAQVEGDTVILTTAVDPHYGIQATRFINLDPKRPAMTIRTEYKKISGEPLRASVWIITQLDDPVAVYMPIPKNSPFHEGFNRQSDKLPLGLGSEDGMLTMRRSPQYSAKIGNDASALLWVGEEDMMLIESARAEGREHPDQNSSAEVYTNPNPLEYVELEFLGPLEEMTIGKTIERTSTYTLIRREGGDFNAQARKALARFR